MIKFLSLVAFNLECLFQHTDMLLDAALENAYIEEYLGKDEDGEKEFTGELFLGTYKAPWDNDEEQMVDYYDTVDPSTLDQEQFTTEVLNVIEDLIINHGVMDNSPDIKEQLIKELSKR